jgi:enoyl-[acyl-carrier protein] reductase II
MRRSRDALDMASVYASPAGSKWRLSMLRTRLCELLGIEHPVIQAAIGPWSSAELVAAVLNAGALGSVGTSLQTAEDLEEQLTQVRRLTDRPFAVNHTARPSNEEAFALTLEASPKIVTFVPGDPSELVGRAHGAGVPDTRGGGRGHR